MSTNIDHSGLPDMATLEKLANQFFNEYHAQGTTAAPAVSGIGVSPASVLQYGNTVDAKEVGVANPPQYAQNDGGVPISVAGSGASPSVVQHGNNINLKDPQTSFPDKNLQYNTGSLPLGGGHSPVAAPKNFLPFEEEQSYLGGLESILSSIHQYIPGNQLPEVASPQWPLGETASYYFLPAGAGHTPSIAHGGFVPGFDANLVKKDFPILQESVNGKPLIWLDNAATTQKPQQVIDRLSYFYAHENSNIHRAAHELAARATDAYEEARKKVQTFIGAASPNEIVFVRGTTEAINLVARSWGEQYLQPGDEILVTHLEHHANIVPWQQLAAKKGLKLRVAPVDDDGQVILEEYGKLLNPKTKLVAFTQVSNALGTITPAKTMIDMAHAVGARVLLDGAQSVSHIRANVKALNADWFVFSGHKIFAPTGIGVLYGKEDLLNATEPWQGGGNMIKDVTFEHTQYHLAPGRFEAGTGNIADAVGLGAALDYVNKLGIENIYQYEHYLLKYAMGLLKEIPGLKLIGTAPDKTSVLSFVLDGYTNDQVGQALNQEGIAVRTGHHCAQPILRRFGLESTVRPSLAFYNTCADIDALVATLWKLKATKK
ncbi:MAG: cysteine desulfurase [Niastella sp.]|nr:cysteine desulfurase [Niastella sp.]